MFITHFSLYFSLYSVYIQCTSFALTLTFLHLLLRVSYGGYLRLRGDRRDQVHGRREMYVVWPEGLLLRYVWEACGCGWEHVRGREERGGVHSGGCEGRVPVVFERGEERVLCEGGEGGGEATEDGLRWNRHGGPRDIPVLVCGRVDRTLHKG